MATLVGLLAGCGSSNTMNQDNSLTAVTTASSGRPKVVATTTVLCDIAQKIAANTIDLTCLLKPGVDGHVYEATPADRRAIEDAQLIFYSGYGFEPNLIKLVQANTNSAPKIAVAEKAVPKPLIGAEMDHDHVSESSAGKADTHGAEEPDPHVWQRASNGMQMTRVMQQALSQLVPEQANLYVRNAQALETELAQLHRWIPAQIATIPANARKLVTTHDAMGYYAAAYHIPVEGALQGISTDEKPSAGRLKELVTEIQSTQVPTIFAEVVVNPKLIEAVAREAGVKVSNRPLFSDSLGEPGSGAETYPKMLITNTQTIVQGLGGKLTSPPQMP